MAIPGPPTILRLGGLPPGRGVGPLRRSPSELVKTCVDLRADAIQCPGQLLVRVLLGHETRQCLCVNLAAWYPPAAGVLLSRFEDTVRDRDGSLDKMEYNSSYPSDSCESSAFIGAIGTIISIGSHGSIARPCSQAAVLPLNTAPAGASLRAARSLRSVAGSPAGGMRGCSLESMPGECAGECANGTQAVDGPTHRASSIVSPWTMTVRFALWKLRPTM